MANLVDEIKSKVQRAGEGETRKAAPLNTESAAMRLLKAIGLESVAWSLRRLHTPVSKDALVLDVGSGGNPYPRANVLIDAYEDTIERFHVPLIKDRPMVMGLAERMPFKDKAFDFVIASHILEHTQDPEAFLKELMRVGGAGYIETPDAFAERVIPYRFHRLECSELGGKIIINRKKGWRHDPEVVDMFEKKMKDKKFIKFLTKHPEPFHMRYYWSEDIDFHVTNPEVALDWPYPENEKGTTNVKRGIKTALREKVRRISRYLFSQNRRNRKINIMDLLICPDCSSEKLTREASGIRCQACNGVFEMTENIPILYPKKGSRE